MKKTLFILCALLLTAVGASAQEATTAYTFKAEDWVSIDANRTADTYITYDDNGNTITVVSQAGSTNYANNVALGNGAAETGTHSTDGYYVTNEQHWFIVVGTNLSTASGASVLWWMNGNNLGGITPSKTVEIEDGQILFAWDVSTYLTEESNTLSGWTGFGLTSSDETNHTSVISDICFYTQEEAVETYPELEDVLHHDAIPYEFHAEDWVSLDLTRLTADGITYNADNTITVTPINGASGTNNVALGNSLTYSDNANAISTNGYYITSDQTCFVIVGKDLSTSGISDLWWLNGVNANVTPSTPISLSDGQTLFYWDFSGNTTVMGKFDDGKMVIDGWTGGGLTSTGTTATISYIGFCKPSEATSSFTIPENTHVHACTANVNVWTATLTGTGTLGDFKVDDAVKNDESGMEPPFLTYYTWEGESGNATNCLPDTKISHETMTGLAAGVYEVSLDIRIIDYDTDAKVGAGTTFNATSGSNTASQDIKLGVDATETSFTDGGDRDDIYGTYTLYVEVGDEGTLDVSLDITGATYNWIMFKNLKVKSLGANATPVTVEGTMGADYGTLILPFDAELSSGSTSTLTAYTAGGVEDDVLTLTQVDDGKLTAGTPYIIGGSANTQYTFSGVPTAYNASNPDANNLLVGTLVNMSLEDGDFTADAGQYVLQNHTEGGLAFYPITTSSSGVTLDAYHCYLTLDSSTYPSGVRAFISLPGSDEATAIKAIEGAEAEVNGAIYDLSGRKVSKAVKGVYIQNGKKVLVK